MARTANATLHLWVTRLVQVERHELRAVLWSFAYFCSLLCGYYILRPMRDAMGIAGGVEQLHWLFTGTFVAMLVVGELLRATRHEKVFAATKVWTDGKQAGVEQMERSRSLWGVPRLDLMQIHNLRDNLEDREVERRLLPLAADRGVAVVVNRPFQFGGLFDKVRGKPLPPWAKELDLASWGQLFLKFAVSHPAVTRAIPATTQVKHMEDNMAAGFGRLPDATARERMVRLVRSG